MQRDKQYYAALLQKTLAQHQYTVNEQRILQDFYNHLNQIISSVLGAISSLASGKVTPQQDLVTSLFLASWNFVPMAGTHISKALTMAANKSEEANAQHLNSVLGNFAGKDTVAEIFCHQAIVYHHARILNGTLEHSTLEGIVADLKAKAKAVIAEFLPQRVQLSAENETLITELLTQFMQSLNASVGEYQKGELQLENLGDYLAQQIIKVDDAPLTKDFAFSGDFNGLAAESRYGIAIDAVRLAQLGYEDKTLISLYAKQWGYTLDKYESFFYQFKNNNRGIVLANQDAVICILRGAPGLAEVQSGFTGVLDELWNEKNGLGNCLSYHAKFPPKRFIFIGHSTGAVLTLLAAERFFQTFKQHNDKLTVFTFGQPRVAQTFSAAFANNVYRFVHPNDPVPFMPPEGLGYSHVGTAYSLPDVTEVFNWDNNSVTVAPNISAIKKEAHDLRAYQSRLIEHARSHSHAALPTYLESEPASTDIRHQLGDKVFRDTFTSQPLSNQLETLRSFSQSLIKELCQTGGDGYVHPIKNSIARVELLLKHYTANNNIEHVAEAQRLNIWLKIAAHQKQNKATFKNLFSNPNVTTHVTSETQMVLGDESLAPLLLITVLKQQPDFHLQAEDLLRVLTAKPLTHYLVQIEVLNLLVSIAKEKKDMGAVLFSHEELIDLTYWLHHSHPVSPADKTAFVNNHILQVLIQLQATFNSPILQELINGFNAQGKPDNILLPALVVVSRNPDVSPKERLFALQIKQKIQVAPHVRSTLENELSEQASDTQPSALRVLTYQDHQELGDLALQADEFALAKSAYIYAYQLLKMQPTLEAECAKVTSKIVSLLWQEIKTKESSWEKSLIYQEILRYDESNYTALRALFDLGLGDAWRDFAEHLSSIGTKLEIKNIDKYLEENKDAVVLQTPFNGTWVLNQNAVDAFDKRASIRNSVHPVAQVGAFHIKENPGLVGLAFAAWALSRWVFLGLSDKPTEWGLIPVQPGKILRKDKPPVIVQLSPTIVGDNVQELLAKNPDPELLKQLDPSHFSALIIMSILLNMGDARDANFVVSQKQLFSIDNDHVFVRDEMESGFASQQIVMKNLVFCLAQMQSGVDNKVIQHLTQFSFAPLSRIRAWLYCMHHYNQTITHVFNETEHKDLFERANDQTQVVLPVFFDSQGILQPATKLFALCNELKKSSPQTHQDLFKAIRKKIATAYEDAFQNRNTLLARMQTIGGLSGVSVSTPGKVIQHNIGKSVKTHKDFKNSQNAPRDILKLLSDIEKDEGLLDRIIQEIASGDITTFAREEGIQELVLEKLNETHYNQSSYTPAVHRALIQAISPAVKYLTFKGNPYLIDAELLSLVERLPALEQITLLACSQIKGTFSRIVDIAGIFQINWLEPWLKQIGLKKLDIQDCDSVTPEFLLLLSFLEGQHSRFSVSFLTEKYDLPLKHHYLAIRHPDWGLLVPPLVPQPTPSITATLECENKVHSLAVLLDGSIMSGLEDGTLIHWQRNSGIWVCAATLKAHIEAVHAILVLPDGSFITFVWGDNTFKHWQKKADTWVCSATLNLNDKLVRTPAVLSDGSIIFSTGNNGHHIQHWQYKGDSWIYQTTLLDKSKNSISHLMGLPNGNILSHDIYGVLQHLQYKAGVWVSETTENQSIEAVSNGNFASVIILPDGDYITSSSRDKAFKHWHLKANKWICVATVNEEDEILDVAALADGSIISSTYKTIKHWQRQASRWICVATVVYKYKICPLDFLVVAPDGNIIFSLDKKIIKHFQFVVPSSVPNIVGKRARLFHNAIQLLQRGCLYPAQIPKLFPEDLLYLDVSNTRITDTILQAILQFCSQLTLENIKIEHCGWLSEKTHLRHRIKKQLSEAEIILENMKFNDEELLTVLCEFSTIQKLTFKSCPNFQGKTLGALQANGIEKIILIDCSGLDLFAITKFEAQMQTSLKLDITQAFSSQQQNAWACVYPENGHFIIAPLVASNTLLLKNHINIEGSICFLLVLPDGSILVGSTSQSDPISFESIKHWEREVAGGVDAWTCIARLEKLVHFPPVVLSDGSILLADSNEIEHWQRKAGTWVCLAKLEGHTKSICSLAVLHDESFISGSKDNTIKHWQRQADTWICVDTLKEHRHSVRSLSVLPDGGFISGDSGKCYYQGGDCTFKHWQRLGNKWSCVDTLSKEYDVRVTVLQDGSIMSSRKHWQLQANKWVCISSNVPCFNHTVLLPDGSIISSSSRGVLDLSQYKTGRLTYVASIQGHHPYPINGLGLLPDGSIISSSWDNTIKHWQFFAFGSVPCITSKRDRLLYNAMQLLQYGKLHPTHVPKLFPADLSTLDVSNTNINDTLLKAILLQCPRVQITAENCIWITQEGRDLIARRALVHTQVPACARWDVVSNTGSNDVNNTIKADETFTNTHASSSVNSMVFSSSK